MLSSKRKLLIENLTLKTRIAHLESLICPHNQHDFVKVGYDFVGGTGRGDEIPIYHYQCRKCDKSVSSWKILDKGGE